MARKKGGNSKGYISQGKHRNVSKDTRKRMRRSASPLTRAENQWDAFSKGKRVMVTIPNPNAKTETARPFIRVTAQEAGWKKQEPYRMKQEG